MATAIKRFHWDDEIFIETSNSQFCVITRAVTLFLLELF